MPNDPHVDAGRAPATPSLALDPAAPSASDPTPPAAHGMKPVAVVFLAANVAVLGVFAGLVMAGWIEIGSTAVAATAG